MRRINNALLYARFDAGLTIKQVSLLLGDRRGEAVGRYERGSRRPALEHALQLEIIYQRPLAFLFPELYEELKGRVQARRQLRSAPKAEVAGGRP